MSAFGDVLIFSNLLSNSSHLLVKHFLLPILTYSGSVQAPRKLEPLPSPIRQPPEASLGILTEPPTCAHPAKVKTTPRPTTRGRSFSRASRVGLRAFLCLFQLMYSFLHIHEAYKTYVTLCEHLRRQRENLSVLDSSLLDFPHLRPLANTPPQAT